MKFQRKTTQNYDMILVQDTELAYKITTKILKITTPTIVSKILH